MTICKLSSRFWFAMALLAAAATSTGCATFSPDPLHLFGTKKAEPLDPSKAVIVELRSESDAPAAIPLSHEDGMLVQDALVKSGAIKKFTRMSVALVRPRPDGKGPHKMDVTYESKVRRVTPGTDYALLPGDRVVVIEDTRTEFDDVVDKLLGPFSGLSRKK